MKNLITIILAVGSLLANATDTKEELYKKVQDVSFLENKGQMTDMNGDLIPFVLFKVSAPGINLFITEQGLTYLHYEVEKVDGQEKNSITMDEGEEHEELKGEWTRIDMELKGARIDRNKIEKEGESKDDKRYFLGHCPDGIKGVRSYQKITIKEVYPGIDWVLYNSSKEGFKYDFVVHPHANPDQIQLAYKSKNKVELDQEGNLNLITRLGSIQEATPISYLKGSKKKVESNYKLISSRLINEKDDAGYETVVTFDIQESGIINRKSKLVIDPVLKWATLFGSDGADGPQCIDSDANGNLFVGGYVISGFNNFPVVDNGTYYEGTFIGAAVDGFIMKFSPENEIIWSTFVGGATVIF